MVFVPSNEDKMQQIFQSFELDLERMTGLGTEALSKLNLPKAGIALRDALVFEGYTVLESSGSFNGVATGVIVGGSIETMNPKQDFYELAQKLGLFYQYGAYYTKRE